VILDRTIKIKSSFENFKGGIRKMQGIGDGIVALLSTIALIYGFYLMITKKLPLYFQLSMASIACLLLGYIFDICDYIVHGLRTEGYMIGYLGSIGSFLFLLTSSIGYMDGIIDDKSPELKKCRCIALIGPVFAVVLGIPNMIADVSIATKVVYSFLWIPAILSSYFNLKHAIIPDMGFGFVKAIRPFNIAAVSFTLLQLIHLTLWNYCDWIPLMISGIFFGSSCIVMIIMADKGVNEWVL
jgi:hypothetical protein